MLYLNNRNQNKDCLIKTILHQSEHHTQKKSQKNIKIYNTDLSMNTNKYEKTFIITE